MLLKLLVILCAIFVYCECAYVYSSFWAPLFDRRILNYRVDVPFEPKVAQSVRELYAKEYGYRGETLIANLGNGRGPGDHSEHGKVYGDVKFYYT